MGSTSLAVQLMLLLAVSAVQSQSMNVNIQQPHGHMYHQQSARNEKFTYGYNVNTANNNQFQHKEKGPDDVTYGCYGYIDPTNKAHLVYYVADRLGYRIIFPNRPTKIYTERISDSLNKLDSAVNSKSYEEKVVAWNDLYLPEPCFRLRDILSPEATAVQQRIVPPEANHPIDSNNELDTLQTTLPSGDTDETGPQTDVHSSGNRTGGRLIDIRKIDQVSTVPFGNVAETDQIPDASTHSHQPQYPGTFPTRSSPDINPALINLDKFNINDGLPQIPGSVNISLLLSQIEAVNSQVITLNMILSGMNKNPTTFSNINEGSCNTVVELLRSQRTSPQLIYVPILIPYIQGEYNINQPFGASTAYFQQQKSCTQCQG